MAATRAFASALILGFASLTHASTNFFGPKAYTIDTGKPQTFIESIAVSSAARCDGKATFILAVTNHGVASARLVLNGTQVFGENDFKAPAGNMEAWVSLSDANNLTVELKGGNPGSSIDVVIRKEIELTLVTTRYTLSDKEGDFHDAMTVAPAGGAFVLEVENSGVKSGSIKINGLEVVSEKELTDKTVRLRKNVILLASNDVQLHLKGDRGSFAVVTFGRLSDESACGLRVTIESPVEGATITSSALFAFGTATGTKDEGVMVNGQPADLDLAHAGTPGDPFRWSSRVDLNAGPATITAVLRNGAGQNASVADRHVTYAPDENGLALIPNMSAEVTPATIEFEIRNAPVALARLEVDLDGDGIYERLFSSIPPLTATYNTPGLKRPSIRVTDANGIVTTATTFVVMNDFGTLDTLIQQRWTDFRNALQRQDVLAAMTYFASDAPQAKYERALNLLFSHLSEVAAHLNGILPVTIRPEYATYLITRNEGSLTAGYYIYFVRDTDGVWRIEQF
jgi:hypothetical protein